MLETKILAISAILVVAPRTLKYDVSLLSFLDAKINFVVILAIDEDCARHYL